MPRNRLNKKNKTPDPSLKMDARTELQKYQSTHGHVNLNLVTSLFSWSSWLPLDQFFVCDEATVPQIMNYEANHPLVVKAIQYAQEAESGSRGDVLIFSYNNQTLTSVSLLTPKNRDAHPAPAQRSCKYVSFYPNGVPFIQAQGSAPWIQCLSQNHVINQADKFVFYEKVIPPAAFIQHLVTYTPHVTSDIVGALPRLVARKMKDGFSNSNNTTARNGSGGAVRQLAAVWAELQGTGDWQTLALEHIECLNVVSVNMQSTTQQQVDQITTKLSKVFSSQPASAPHTLILDNCSDEKLAAGLLKAKPPCLARLVIRNSKLNLLPLLEAASTCATIEELILGQGEHTVSGGAFQLVKKCKHLEFFDEEPTDLDLAIPPARFVSKLPTPKQLPKQLVSGREELEVDKIPVTVNGIYTFCLTKGTVLRSKVPHQMLAPSEKVDQQKDSRIQVHTKASPLEPLPLTLELVETKIWQLAFHFLENVVSDPLQKNLAERFSAIQDENSQEIYDFWNKEFEIFLRLVMAERGDQKDRILAASQLLGIGMYLDSVSLKAFAAVALVIVAQEDQNSTPTVGSPSTTTTAGGEAHYDMY